MILTLKNKMASIGGSSEVTNADNVVLFKVKGKVFSFSKEKNVYNESGDKIFTIKNKLFTIIHSASIFDGNGYKIATLRESFGGFRSVEDCADVYEIKRVKGLVYELYKNGDIFATVKKQYFKLVDTLVINVIDEELMGEAVAFAVCIDNVQDKRQDSQN